MARVVVTRRLPQPWLEPLVAAGHEIVQPPGAAPWAGVELQSELAGADALVCLLTDRIDAGVLHAGAAGQLKVVGNVAVGFDNIDLATARQLGIAVCNTPGVLDETTADVAVLLMLAAARRASEAEADLRAGRWTGWAIDQYLGHDVHGAVLGLVGYGRIAKAVERRTQGFAMTVLHHTRHDSGLPGFVSDLGDLLARSDIVSVHIPLTDSTRHLIGSAELALMKPTAVLVNTSRGAVIDEGALAQALESGQIFAAGLDVYDGEPRIDPRLLAAPRTVLLPHIGSASVATRSAMVGLACEGVCDVLAGRTPRHLVTA
jgi:glyoxylate reductase